MVVASGQASIHLSSGTPLAQVDSALAAAGVARAADLGNGWLSVSWSDGSPVAGKLSALKNILGVDKVEPSAVYRASRAPNDPLFSSQYALAQVSAPAGWEFEIGSSSRVTVAVVDSGIDGTQPDLSGKLTNTTSQIFDQTTGAASVNNPPTPACNHATRVAGVAAASTDNTSQVAGLSWGAQLVSLKVLADASCDVNCCSATHDCSALGNTCGASDQAIVGALTQAKNLENTAAYGLIVVNMSLGASNTACPGAVQAAVTAAVNAGVVVVAAAGNDGGAVNSPGNCAGVIPMGATDNTGQIASFSSRGPELSTNGLAAPGVAVLTTDLNGGTASATGTSFSSPMGAGLAALILSAKPSTTPNAALVSNVQSLMRGGAQSVGQPSTAQGAGQMNVFRSLRLATKGTLAGFDGDQKPIAFPNPFRVSAGTTVNISIPTGLAGSGTDIKIYTMTGHIVRELSTPVWDGKNADGRLVASGSYMFVVKTSAGSSSGRLAVIR
jgi:thermitase